VVDGGVLDPLDGRVVVLDRVSLGSTPVPLAATKTFWGVAQLPR